MNYFLWLTISASFPSKTIRSTPRRAASLKKTSLYDVESCDTHEDPDEPNYQVSDSDDDPDFAPDVSCVSKHLIL